MSVTTLMIKFEVTLSQCVCV